MSMNIFANFSDCMWAPHAWEGLARILRILEHGGDWPSSMTFAALTLIPNPGADPSDPMTYSGITLMSAFYRYDHPADDKEVGGGKCVPGFVRRSYPRGQRW